MRHLRRMPLRGTTEKAPGFRSSPERRTWTADEDDFIRKHGRAMPDRSISERLGRSLRSIQHRRKRLGVAKQILKRWSHEEDEAIRACIGRGGYARELVERYGRRLSEWSSRARQLGVSFQAGRRAAGVAGTEYRGRRIVGHREGQRVFEHTVVMEEKLGRRLRRGECIHHIDHDKRNNRIENLHLCGSVAEHRKIHCSFDRIVPELVRRGLIRFDSATGVYELCETSS